LARKKSATLTEAELRIMHVLWGRPESTVADVVAALDNDPPLAYSTILTTMRILEEKGYVAHVKDGKAFVYRTLVAQQDASRSAVRHILSQFFGNSPEKLVMNLIESEDLSPKELRRLKKMIEESEA
jgi:predicted transcriptional regulator